MMRWTPVAPGKSAINWDEKIRIPEFALENVTPEECQQTYSTGWYVTPIDLLVNMLTQKLRVYSHQTKAGASAEKIKEQAKMIKE